MLRYNMIPLTNKPTRVTRHSANVTNNVKGHNGFKSAIIKNDLPDHFPIVFALKSNEATQKVLLRKTAKV